jgi:hypothetical protein
LKRGIVFFGPSPGQVPSEIQEAPYSLSTGPSGFRKKYSSDFFFEVFFSFLPPLIMYHAYGRKKRERKQGKISPFLYILVGKGSENRPFWD